MPVRIPEILLPPRFEDEEKDRTAELLNVILWASFIPASAFFIVWFLLNPEQRIFHPAIVATVAVTFGLVLMHRGFVREVSIMLVGLLWLNVHLAVWNEGTIRGLSSSTYLVVILIGGLLLGRRATIVLTLLSILASGAMALAEHRGLLPPGPNPSLLVSWSALSGNLVMAAVVLVLATQSLRRALQRSRDLNESLRVEIAERQKIREERERVIAELEEKTLALEEKTAEVERFTFAVSHDLKSPLFTVQGFLSMIETDAAAGNTKRLREDVGHIRHATTRMRRMLDDLMELSQAGTLRKNDEDIPFEEIALEAVDLVAGQIAERGVEVVIAPGMPSVVGDRGRLVQVVQNLVDNAVKYMGVQPEPRIEIGFRPEGTTEACFYVRDNGSGIDREHLETVFQLFTRLDTRQDGTGIGLAHVCRVVEAHGGRIWVESGGRGKGSTFCFTLP